MLETFGAYVRNILKPRLEEFLARINLCQKENFKICTIWQTICYEILFIVQCDISYVHFIAENH